MSWLPEAGKIPVANFSHDGVQYKLVGNVDRARSHFHVARAYVTEMVRRNVQDLPLLQEEMVMDDGSILRFSIDYGRKNVEILVVGKAEHQELPDIDVKVEGETLISESYVPCLLTHDATGIVACLSGTFDGPYYYFENELELPENAFDDEEPSQLHMQRLSTGQSPINGGVPELHFIAHTGIRPAFEDVEEEWSGGYADRIEDPINWGYYPCPGGGQTISQLLEINFVQPEDGPKYIWKYKGSALNLPVGFSFYTEQGSRKQYMPGGTYAELENDWQSHTYRVDLAYGEYCIRLEPDSIENQAILWEYYEDKVTTHYYWADLPCPYFEEVEETDQTVEGTFYGCYLRVNGVDYPLREVSTDYHPQLAPRYGVMRYYNTGSPVAVTVLVPISKTGGPTSTFYHYLGPQTENELHVTEFPYFSTGKHTVPDERVIGFNDPVAFYGVCFMGLIRVMTSKPDNIQIELQ